MNTIDDYARSISRIERREKKLEKIRPSERSVFSRWSYYSDIIKKLTFPEHHLYCDLFKYKVLILSYAVISFLLFYYPILQFG